MQCKKCGAKLEFVERVFRKGLDPLLIKLGCPSCFFILFYLVEDIKEVNTFPKMNQLVWLELNRRCISGNVEKKS
jgi:hypothetical protein